MLRNEASLCSSKVFSTHRDASFVTMKKSAPLSHRQFSLVSVKLSVHINASIMKTYRYCLLGLLMFLSLPSIAQKRFSFGITAAPVLSHTNARYTLFLPDGNGQLYRDTFETRSTIGGYTVGIPIQYNITPNWSVTSGLWHTQLRSMGPFPLFQQGTTPVSARIISSSYRVPLTVNYRLTTQRLSPFFSLGTVASFRGTTRFKPEEGLGLKGSKLILGSKEVSFQALVGAGVAYQINEHWSLTAQPQLIWYFKPGGNYERYVSYQANGQVQLLYSF